MRVRADRPARRARHRARRASRRARVLPRDLSRRASTATRGIAGPFVQDNHSRSVRGTLRGLHLQVRRPQGKLIRVDRGRDLRRRRRRPARLADVRPLGRRDAVGRELPAVLRAAGFAHGFCVLSADRAGRVQVHGPLRSRRRARHRLERSRDWRFEWPVGEPLLSDATAAQSARSPRPGGPRCPFCDPGTDL